MDSKSRFKFGKPKMECQFSVLTKPGPKLSNNRFIKIQGNIEPKISGTNLGNFKIFGKVGKLGNNLGLDQNSMSFVKHFDYSCQVDEPT